jgi:hypothetical protein
MKSVTAPPRMKSNMGEPLETVAGEDVEDGHREGADTDGDHEKVEHGSIQSEGELPAL